MNQLKWFPATYILDVAGTQNLTYLVVQYYVCVLYVPTAYST